MASYGATAVWGPVTPASRPVLTPAPVAPTTVTPVRLTRRGRLLRAVVIVALAMAVAALGVLAAARMTGQPARAGTAVGAPVATASVVVERGESLWVIAERVAPGTDPREVVREIRALNGLRSNLIQPGQRLLVPARG